MTDSRCGSSLCLSQHCHSIVVNPERLRRGTNEHSPLLTWPSLNGSLNLPTAAGWTQNELNLRLADLVPTQWPRGTRSETDGESSVVWSSNHARGQKNARTGGLLAIRMP